ncbi:hypothetical protein ACT1WM_21020 [Bacillus stercoris]|uniref:hypothetical protein n=1 Tax=Bacillus stercoris TaxID=2054641 RepID=UPI00402ABD43
MDPGSSGRRSRSAGGGCQEPADKGREYGQASAEPAAGIQDLREGRSRSARARCQERADKGRKYGQDSDKPAVGI